MSRWTQYDEDEHRLPEGVVRVGYDADTQRYTFRRGDELLLGEPGVHDGGQMTSIGFVNVEAEEQGRVTSNGARRSDGYQPLGEAKDDVVSNRYANRTLYPFMLLVCLFLVVVWKYVGHSTDHGDHGGNHGGRRFHCIDGDTAPTYRVKPGDSCWKIANSHGLSLDTFLNQTIPKPDCDHLKPGDVVCLPLQSLIEQEN